MTRTRLIAGAVVLVCVGFLMAVVLFLVVGGGSSTSRDSATSERRGVAPGAPTGSAPESTPSSSDTVPKRPAKSAESAGPAVVKDHSMQVGLIRREYLTVVPEDVRAGEKLPVVLVLHGLGVDRNRMLNSADWKGAVGRDRFVAVFPQGFGNSWNLGPCCPPASLLSIDDMSFIDQVMNQVKASSEVDPDRMFITGFSAGGLMTYAVVCARPGVYSAMAPMAGSNVLRCKPSKPISLLHQHSDPDPVVPFAGGLGVGQIVSSAPLPSVPVTVAEWAAADGCGPTPTSTSGPSGVERFSWSKCSEETSVELVRIPGRGHEWPKVGDYDGLTETLRFFGLE